MEQGDKYKSFLEYLKRENDTLKALIFDIYKKETSTSENANCLHFVPSHSKSNQNEILRDHKKSTFNLTKPTPQKTSNSVNIKLSTEPVHDCINVKEFQKVDAQGLKNQDKFFPEISSQPFSLNRSVTGDTSSQYIEACYKRPLGLEQYRPEERGEGNYNCIEGKLQEGKCLLNPPCNKENTEIQFKKLTQNQDVQGGYNKAHILPNTDSLSKESTICFKRSEEEAFKRNENFNSTYTTSQSECKREVLSKFTGTKEGVKVNYLRQDIKFDEEKDKVRCMYDRNSLGSSPEENREKFERGRNQQDLSESTHDGSYGRFYEESNESVISLREKGMRDDYAKKKGISLGCFDEEEIAYVQINSPHKIGSPPFYPPCLMEYEEDQINLPPVETAEADNHTLLISSGSKSNINRYQNQFFNSFSSQPNRLCSYSTSTWESQIPQQSLEKIQDNHGYQFSNSPGLLNSLSYTSFHTQNNSININTNSSYNTQIGNNMKFSNSSLDLEPIKPYIPYFLEDFWSFIQRLDVWSKETCDERDEYTASYLKTQFELIYGYITSSLIEKQEKLLVIQRLQNRLCAEEIGKSVTEGCFLSKQTQTNINKDNTQNCRYTDTYNANPTETLRLNFNYNQDTTQTSIINTNANTHSKIQNNHIIYADLPPLYWSFLVP